MLDELSIGAPRWILPAAGVAVALLLLVVGVYWRSPARTPIRFCAALLKLMAIAALIICLLEPLRSGQRPRSHANVVALVVDNSQSMRIKDPAARTSRHERLLPILDKTASWRVRLAQDFDVRCYTFDSRLQSVDDFSTLAFDGHTSSMGAALETAGARFRNRPVAGLLLFSDGNATDLAKGNSSLTRLGFPVFPVVDEKSGGKMNDLRIATITANQTDFEASPVTLNVQTVSTGFEGQKFVVQLFDEDGEQIEEQLLTCAADDDPTDIRFRFRPKQSGVQFYRVALFSAAERESFEQGKSKTEATLANNVRVITVDRRSGPYRVLYLAGRPNWEFKFLRRALQEDAEIELVGLVRVARKEPKFTFRDRSVDSTNPLYAGFSEEADDEAQQYDEPVYIRLGIHEANELRDGFPKTTDQLFAYHAVILDDIEAASFTQDQMLMLREFVSARGGGLLMLGGQESFTKGKYDHTPLGELSPVYVTAGAVEQTSGPYRIQLTREGWLQPWMRVRSTEVAERKRLADMPSFATLNPTGGIKPGASVLATVENQAGSDIPAFVAQRFGKGRSAALLIGDMWRWAMHRKPDEEQDLEQVWRQTVRWLVSEVPRQVDVQVIPPDDPSKPASIQVVTYDDDFKPLDNAEVQLTVRSPNGEQYPLTVESSSEKAGVYTASYWPPVAGGYRVQAAVLAPDGTEPSKRAAGWTAEPAAAEFHRLEANESLLYEIARQTGGEVISQDKLARFVASLPDRKIPVTENWVYPWWHRPWVLVFAIVCLCGEWGLRRWKGLP